MYSERVLTVYIETTIPSYYTGRRPRDIILAARQELTVEWWEQHRQNYELYSSQVVLDEIRRGNPLAAAKREGCLVGVPLLDISEKVIQLAEALISSKLIPPKAADDAYHIACAGVHQIDFLLTWNCTHIANPHIRRHLRQLLTRHGIEIPVICTPEELIGEDYNEDSD